MTLIIGIDPDSKAHGIAIYKNNKLVELLNIQLMDIINRFLIPKIECHFIVEHVTSNKPIFSSSKILNVRAQGKKGQNVGQCKQAQIEIIRALDYYNARYQLQVPIPGNWGTSKNPEMTKFRTKQFQIATGWKGRSNSDTRSAAFFGFLGVNQRSIKRDNVI